MTQLSTFQPKWYPTGTTNRSWTFRIRQRTLKRMMKKSSPSKYTPRHWSGVVR